MHSLFAILFNGLLFFSTTSAVHTETNSSAEHNVQPVTNNMLLNMVDLCNLSYTECVTTMQVSVKVNTDSEIEIVAVNGDTSTPLDPEMFNQLKFWMMGSGNCFEADTTYSIYMNVASSTANLNG